MGAANRVILIALLIAGGINFASAQTATPQQISRLAQSHSSAGEPSPSYRQVQQCLAQGWNSWDVNSVTTEVFLPDGLAIHAGLKHNTTESSDAFLKDALIGRLEPGAEQVFPGPHSWDGGYTELKLTWKGHSWRMQGANDNGMLVWLATPLLCMCSM